MVIAYILPRQSLYTVGTLLNLGLQKFVVAEAIALSRARIVVVRTLFRTLVVVISALGVGQLGDRLINSSKIQ